MGQYGGISKIIYALALSVAISICNLGLSASAKKIDKLYTETNLISGELTSTPLLINRRSIKIDLSKTSNIRFALDLKDYYSSIGRHDIFTIKVYDLSYGTRKLINHSRIKIHKAKARYKIFKLNLGNYKNQTRDLEIELLDHNNNLINTYAQTIQPQNLVSETDSFKEKIDNSSCDNTNFGECHLDYIVENINFETKSRKDLSTEVLKKEDGSYLVSIPSLRRKNPIKTIRYKNVNNYRPSRKIETSANTKNPLDNINDNIKFINSDYDVGALDSILIVDSSEAPINLNLPNPSLNTGLQLIIKRINSGNNQVTVKANEYKLDGETSYSLDYEYEAITLLSTGSEWLIL